MFQERVAVASARHAGNRALRRLSRRYVDRAIYDEMVKNRFLPETRTALLGIIDELRSQGAQAVVLGCTEIPLLIRPDDCPLPMYDTLAIHAAAGVEFMVG